MRRVLVDRPRSHEWQPLARNRSTGKMQWAMLLSGWREGNAQGLRTTDYLLPLFEAVRYSMLSVRCSVRDARCFVPGAWCPMLCVRSAVEPPFCHSFSPFGGIRSQHMRSSCTLRNLAASSELRPVHYSVPQTLKNLYGAFDRSAVECVML